MASCGTTCPVCKRVVAFYRKTGVLYPHMPYDRKSQADLLARGRRCIGSSKTPEQAEQAEAERLRRVREWIDAGRPRLA